MSAVIFSTIRTVEFDHDQRIALRWNTDILLAKHGLSLFDFNFPPDNPIERVDYRASYTYLVKLPPLDPEDTLSVELKVNMTQPNVNPTLTVMTETIIGGTWKIYSELPKDARPAGLDDVTFNLTADRTFIIVVPRRMSLFWRGVERTKEVFTAFKGRLVRTRGSETDTDSD